MSRFEIFTSKFPKTVIDGYQKCQKWLFLKFYNLDSPMVNKVGIKPYLIREIRNHLILSKSVALGNTKNFKIFLFASLCVLQLWSHMLISFSIENGLKIFQIFWKSPLFRLISDTYAKMWTSTARTKDYARKYFYTRGPKNGYTVWSNPNT